MIIPLLSFVVAGGDWANLLIQLVIAGLIFWLVVWFADWIGLPEPFRTVLRVLLGLVALIFLINVLASLGGHGFFWSHS